MDKTEKVVNEGIAQIIEIIIEYIRQYSYLITDGLLEGSMNNFQSFSFNSSLLPQGSSDIPTNSTPLPITGSTDGLHTFELSSKSLCKNALLSARNPGNCLEQISRFILNTLERLDGEFEERILVNYLRDQIEAIASEKIREMLSQQNQNKSFTIEDEQIVEEIIQMKQFQDFLEEFKKLLNNSQKDISFHFKNIESTPIQSSRTFSNQHYQSLNKENSNPQSFQRQYTDSSMNNPRWNPNIHPESIEEILSEQDEGIKEVMDFETQSNNSQIESKINDPLISSSDMNLVNVEDLQKIQSMLEEFEISSNLIAIHHIIKLNPNDILWFEEISAILRAIGKIIPKIISKNNDLKNSLEIFKFLGKMFEIAEESSPHKAAEIFLIFLKVEKFIDMNWKKEYETIFQQILEFLNLKAKYLSEIDFKVSENICNSMIKNTIQLIFAKIDSLCKLKAENKISAFQFIGLCTQNLRCNWASIWISRPIFCSLILSNLYDQKIFGQMKLFFTLDIFSNLIKSTKKASTLLKEKTEIPTIQIFIKSFLLNAEIINSIIQYANAISILPESQKKILGFEIGDIVVHSLSESIKILLYFLSNSKECENFKFSKSIQTICTNIIETIIQSKIFSNKNIEFSNKSQIMDTTILNLISWNSDSSSSFNEVQRIEKHLKKSFSVRSSTIDLATRLIQFQTHISLTQILDYGKRIQSLLYSITVFLQKSLTIENSNRSKEEGAIGIDEDDSFFSELFIFYTCCLNFISQCLRHFEKHKIQVQGEDFIHSICNQLEFLMNNLPTLTNSNMLIYSVLDVYSFFISSSLISSSLEADLFKLSLSYYIQSIVMIHIPAFKALIFESEKYELPMSNPFLMTGLNCVMDSGYSKMFYGTLVELETLDELLHLWMFGNWLFENSDFNNEVYLENTQSVIKKIRKFILVRVRDLLLDDIFLEEYLNKNENALSQLINQNICNFQLTSSSELNQTHLRTLKIIQILTLNKFSWSQISSKLQLQQHLQVPSPEIDSNLEKIISSRINKIQENLQLNLFIEPNSKSRNIPKIISKIIQHPVQKLSKKQFVKIISYFQTQSQQENITNLLSSFPNIVSSIISTNSKDPEGNSFKSEGIGIDDEINQMNQIDQIDNIVSNLQKLHQKIYQEKQGKMVLTSEMIIEAFKSYPPQEFTKIIILAAATKNNLESLINFIVSNEDMLFLLFYTNSTYSSVDSFKQILKFLDQNEIPNSNIESLQNLCKFHGYSIQKYIFDCLRILNIGILPLNHSIILFLIILYFGSKEILSKMIQNIYLELIYQRIKHINPWQKSNRIESQPLPNFWNSLYSFLNTQIDYAKILNNYE